MDPIDTLITMGQGVDAAFSLAAGGTKPYDPTDDAYSPNAPAAPTTIKVLWRAPEEGDSRFVAIIIARAADMPAGVTIDSTTVTIGGVDYTVKSKLERIYDGVVNGYMMGLAK